MPAAVVELLQQNAAGTAASSPVTPESVFSPCEQPTLQGNTWGDAVSYVGTANSFINMPRKGGYTEQVARIGRKIEKAPAGWG